MGLSVLPTFATTPLQRASMLHRREAIRYLEHVVKVNPELLSKGMTSNGSDWASVGGGGRGGVHGDLLSAVGEDAAASGTSSSLRGWASGQAVLGSLVVLHAWEGGSSSQTKDAGRAEVEGAAAQEDRGEGNEPPSDDEERLLRFLANHEGNPLLDLYFSLRVCNERGHARATVQLYGYMG